MKVAGKLAVVTGGSSGIGLNIAQALAEAGARVVVTGRNRARLEAAAQTHPDIEGIVCDVTDDAAIAELVVAADERGGADLIVNNAGVMDFFDVKAGHPIAKQAQEVDIDVLGPLRMVHHFLPGMLERGGCIVNVSSGLAYVPFAAAPVYSGAKAFVHAWTRSLRQQLRGSSVRIVELLPPVVDTPLATNLDPSFSRMPPAVLAKAFLRGLERGREEITPGQSVILKWLGRLAPGLAFWVLNRGS
jgi:uncharacterized oxidoreductase